MMGQGRCISLQVSIFPSLRRAASLGSADLLKVGWGWEMGLG